MAEFCFCNFWRLWKTNEPWFLESQVFSHQNCLSTSLPEFWFASSQAATKLRTNHEGNMVPPSKGSLPQKILEQKTFFLFCYRMWQKNMKGRRTYEDWGSKKKQNEWSQFKQKKKNNLKNQEEKTKLFFLFSLIKTVSLNLS